MLTLARVWLPNELNPLDEVDSILDTKLTLADRGGELGRAALDDGDVEFALVVCRNNTAILVLQSIDHLYLSSALDLIGKGLEHSAKVSISIINNRGWKLIHLLNKSDIFRYRSYFLPIDAGRIAFELYCLHLHRRLIVVPLDRPSFHSCSITCEVGISNSHRAGNGPWGHSSAVEINRPS
jgi:hypothetical protein